MLMTLKRRWLNDRCTIGQLYLDGMYSCFVLEDRVREVPGQAVITWKIAGETAIPYGVFEIATSFSQRFGRELPLVLAVPGFDSIRIHPGNDAADTEGCLLPGVHRGNFSVTNSREAFSILFLTIKRELTKAKVKLSVELAADAEDVRTVSNGGQ